MLSPSSASAQGRYLTGLIGQGIAASRSPWLHEHEADALGARLVYTLYDFSELGLSADDLPAMLQAASRLRFAGLNITHPFKQAVIPHLDELSEDARRIGAVNTVAFENGRSKGYNTDCLGFAESLRRGLPDAPLDRIVQIGAGGAGAAVVHALLGRGAGRLELFDRDLGRARSLVESLTEVYGADRVAVSGDLAASLAGADGVVNATPVGMVGYPGLPIPEEALRPDLWVADIVYFPVETELLRKARALGCKTLDGTGMVVFQAAAAFEIFTGLQSDRERMLATFRDSLSQSNGGE